MFRAAMVAVALVVASSISVPVFIHGSADKVQAVRAATPVKRQLYPFAATFRSQVNAYAFKHHKPPITQVSCLRGDQAHYACSFWLRGFCHLAFTVYQRDGVVDVERAGKPLVAGPNGKPVPVPKDLCYARQVFKRVFKG